MPGVTQELLLTDNLLLDYKRCQRRAFLNIYGDASEREPDRDFLLKLRQDSQAHIQSVLSERYPDFRRLETVERDWKTRSQETQALMAQGVDCIFRGVLAQSYSAIPDAVANEADAAALAIHLDTLAQLRVPPLTPSNPQHPSGGRMNEPLNHQPLNHDPPHHEPLYKPLVTLMGRPHLLVKQPGKSRFGDWHYEPISIQFGRRPKPEYKIVSAFHAQLLAHLQGAWPNRVQMILRHHNAYRLDLEIWLPRLQEVLCQFLPQLRRRHEPEVFISRQRCSLCHWKQHCYAIAQSQQHLSLVPGVTPNRYEHLQALGVANVPSLADACATSMAEVMGADVATALKQQAQALVHNQPLLKLSQTRSQPPLPTAAVELYFDIEAEPERNLDYLLGVLRVDHVNQREDFLAFLAESPDEERTIWKQFIAFTKQYPSAPIYHFSDYEVETIKRLARLYHTPPQIRNRLVTRCIDLHRYVTHSVILPVENYSLKSLAHWLGFQWRDQEASGDQSVCWYDQWLKDRDRHLLASILRYNEDDCRATYHLKAWLTRFLQDAQGESNR